MPTLKMSSLVESRDFALKNETQRMMKEVKELTEDLSVLFTSVFYDTWVDQCRVEATLAEPRAMPTAAGKRLTT